MRSQLPFAFAVSTSLLIACATVACGSSTDAPPPAEEDAGPTDFLPGSKGDAGHDQPDARVDTPQSDASHEDARISPPKPDAAVDANPPVPDDDAGPWSPGPLPERVYFGDVGGLHYVPTAGGSPVLVDAKRPDAIRVSPGGTHFLTWQRTSNAITVFDANLTKVGALTGRPIGWADADRVLFGTTTQTTGGSEQIHNARFDGTDDRVILQAARPPEVNGDFGYMLFPKGLSPDGKRLVVECETPWTMQVISTLNGHLFGEIPWQRAYDLTWTSDGHIVWLNTGPTHVSNDTLGTHKFVPNLDSSPGVSVPGDVYRSTPGRILVHRQRADAPGAPIVEFMQTIGTDGSAVASFAPTTGIVLSEVQASLDGSALVFARDPITTAGTIVEFWRGTEVWFANADGSGGRKLSDAPGGGYPIAW